MKYVVETERLLVRELAIDDAPFILKLVNTPGWLENIGDRHIKTDEQARIYLRHGPLASYIKNGFGLYLIWSRTDQVPIGMSGFLQRENLENPDIGFAFLPEFTGKGYAFEAAAALIDFAANTLKVPVISAIVLPTNSPSIKLLGKLGMTYQKAFISPDTNDELMLFSNQHD